MKFYADIILSGENFNPFYVTEQYHINFSKALKKGGVIKKVNEQADM